MLPRASAEGGDTAAGVLGALGVLRAAAERGAAAASQRLRARMQGDDVPRGEAADALREALEEEDRVTRRAARALSETEQALGRSREHLHQSGDALAALCALWPDDELKTRALGSPARRLDSPAASAVSVALGDDENAATWTADDDGALLGALIDAGAEVAAGRTAHVDWTVAGAKLGGRSGDACAVRWRELADEQLVLASDRLAAARRDAGAAEAAALQWRGKLTAARSKAQAAAARTRKCQSL